MENKELQTLNDAIAKIVRYGIGVSACAAVSHFYYEELTAELKQGVECVAVSKTFLGFASEIVNSSYIGQTANDFAKLHKQYDADMIDHYVAGKVIAGLSDTMAYDWFAVQQNKISVGDYRTGLTCFQAAIQEIFDDINRKEDSIDYDRAGFKSAVVMTLARAGNEFFEKHRIDAACRGISAQLGNSREYRDTKVLSIAFFEMSRALESLLDKYFK